MQHPYAWTPSPAAAAAAADSNASSTTLRTHGLLAAPGANGGDRSPRSSRRASRGPSVSLGMHGMALADRAAAAAAAISGGANGGSNASSFSRPQAPSRSRAASFVSPHRSAPSNNADVLVIQNTPTDGGTAEFSQRKEAAEDAWRRVCARQSPLDVGAIQDAAARTSVAGGDDVDVTEPDSDAITTSLLLIKPDAMARQSDAAIVQRVRDESFEIIGYHEFVMTRPDVETLFADHVLVQRLCDINSQIDHLNAFSSPAAWAEQRRLQDQSEQVSDDFASLIQFMTSGPVAAIACRQRRAVQRLIALCGDEDPLIAREYQPTSLRALYGTDIEYNAVHCSADSVTAQRELRLLLPLFTPDVVSTYAMIKPDAVRNGNADSILHVIQSEGFEIVRQRKTRLTQAQAEQFYAEHRGRPFFASLVAFMTSGQIVALELRRANAIGGWRLVAGPTNSAVARQVAPTSIRARFGEDGQCNAVHGSDSAESAARELRLMFETFVPPPQITVAIVKPDGVASDRVDAIVARAVSDGFEVLRRESILLTREQTEELYAEHRSRAFFSGLCQFMSAAPIVALALRRENAVARWREMCGPVDSVAARQVAPMSLRATFGLDLLRNAVYGSKDEAAARADYAMLFERLCPQTQTTFAFIKPDAVAAGVEDAIFDRIRAEGFDIVQMARLRLTTEHVHAFYAEHVHRPFFPSLLEFMTSGPVCALALRKDLAVSSWRALCGPTNVELAKQTAPNSLRALYGTDGTRNAVHGSDRVSSAERELELVFQTICPPVQTTYAMIKPDAVRTGHAAAILQRVQSEGFEIVRVKRTTLSVAQAERFYGEHAAKSFFRDLVAFMTSGPVVAIALRRHGAIRAWRALAGPTNSNVARDSAPTSIRALFGTDGQQNAVHGSDSEASAKRELDLVFGEFVPEMESTFAFIKPDAVRANRVHDILARVRDNGFEIVRKVKLHLNEQQACTFYAEHAGRLFLPQLVAFMTSGAVVALELRRLGAITAWRKLCGPTNSRAARQEAPSSLRALFGTDGQQNAVHGSDSVQSAKRELALVFGEFAKAIESSLVLFKSSTLRAGHHLALLSELRQLGFDIVRAERQTWSPTHVQQFYLSQAGQIYFLDLIQTLAHQSMLAVHVQREQAIERLSEWVGPTDPSSAKITHPRSVRARFGVDRLVNAVHTSVSTAAAARELKLVFEEYVVGVQDSLAVVHPDVLLQDNDAKVVAALRDEGFEIVFQIEKTLTKEQVVQLYGAQLSNARDWNDLLDVLTCAESLLLIVRKENAVRHLDELARETHPFSLNALYGARSVLASVDVADAARQIDLVRNVFFVGLQSTYAMIKPDATSIGAEIAILRRIREEGFLVVRKRRFQMSLAQAQEFYGEHRARSFFDELVAFMTSGPVLALELRRDNAIRAWRALAGPTNSLTAKETQPNTIRALFGTDGQHNAVHGSDSVSSAARELQLVFDAWAEPPQVTTFAMLKPDAIKRGLESEILKHVYKAGLDVHLSKKVKLSPEDVMALYHDHMSQPYFKAMLEYMLSGPVLLLALRERRADSTSSQSSSSSAEGNGAADAPLPTRISPTDTVIDMWRRLIGPTNPRNAQKTHPISLRALFGTDHLKNAVHGSDSPDTAQRELQLMFPEAF